MESINGLRLDKRSTAAAQGILLGRGRCFDPADRRSATNHGEFRFHSRRAPRRSIRRIAERRRKRPFISDFPRSARGFESYAAGLAPLENAKAVGMLPTLETDWSFVASERTYERDR